MPDTAPGLRRVLMTADTVGDVWPCALELARVLHQRGVQVVLATMGGPLNASQQAQIRNISGLTVCESSFKFEGLEDSWSDMEQAGEWLLGLEEAVEPDVIHLNGYVHGALGWRRPMLVVGHSCVLSWWEAIKGETAPASWERYRSQVARGLQAADLVLAPTQARLSALERSYGCFARSRVVPNGCDPRCFPPADKESFILAFGRLWDETENISMFDQVAPLLSWPTYVAGVEQHPDGGPADYRAVRPLGHLSPPDLARWLSHAAIYTLPARYEPFGLSVLEAGLAGCALVLGDIPSLRETWDGAALFIPPDDAAMLTTALQTLIRERSYRLELAASARRRALQYTPERMLRGYMMAYQELLQTPPSPGRYRRSAARHSRWIRPIPAQGG